jgi:hypothetical protein
MIGEEKITFFAFTLKGGRRPGPHTLVHPKHIAPGVSCVSQFQRREQAASRTPDLYARAAMAAAFERETFEEGGLRT